MSGKRSNRKKPKMAVRKASGAMSSKSSKPAASPHWQQTGQHIYRYHPPRADHPMLQLAQQAIQLASVPQSVDLRQLCTPIRDQGKEESCSGFATAAFRETSYVAKTGVLLPYYLSPAYLYGWTRISMELFQCQKKPPKNCSAATASWCAGMMMPIPIGSSGTNGEKIGATTATATCLTGMNPFGWKPGQPRQRGKARAVISDL
jgi:hypothetical protein